MKELLYNADNYTYKYFQLPWGIYNLEGAQNSFGQSQSKSSDNARPVSLCVCLWRSISETAPRIFPKPGTKLGVKKCKKRSTAAFFEIFACFLENRSFVRKKNIFGSFWALRKIRSEDFA